MIESADKHENRKNIAHQTLLSDVVKMFHVLQVHVAAFVVPEVKTGAQLLHKDLEYVVFPYCSTLYEDFYY